ncbi:MAG: hypothetical protein H8E66_02400 [Planctomycetes bacterium]|nr:hypothetical protein [Planctomycetota bacterium]
MNTNDTKAFIEKHGIIALRADKTQPAPEIDRLMEQLGHQSGTIPFYAIFPAGSPNKPILLDGVYTSPKPFLEAFEKAGASSIVSESLANSGLR